MPEVPGEPRVMIRAPRRDVAGVRAERLIACAVLPHDVECESVDETPRRVALRELFADGDGGDQTLVRFGGCVDPALHHAEGVVYQMRPT